MKCEYCEILSGRGRANILYEDNDIIVAIKDTVTTPGQITIFPKEHYTIMEMVPEQILEKCSIISNKISIAVFESLGAQGTNIVVQNGLSAGQKVPHFAIEVIPRREGDGLNLQWEPKQLEEHEMEGTVSSLKEALKNLEKSIKKEKKSVKKENPDTETEEEKEENYLIKSLKRIP
jgi:histidine triad (HIT) family protein